MTHIEQIEIPLSKKNIWLNCFLGILISVTGILFLINPSYFVTRPFFPSPWMIFITGIGCVLFFGFGTVLFFRKLSDKRIGLTINKEGIIDNSSAGVSAGLILWSDIEEIKVCEIFRQKFLIIVVKNPQEYLAKVKNPLKRKTMETNFKMTGSPISISDGILKTDFDKLYMLLIDKMKEYKL